VQERRNLGTVGFPVGRASVMRTVALDLGLMRASYGERALSRPACSEHREDQVGVDAN
jgi:hypothetical protein